MRILHVITTLDVGGAEMHILSQVRGQTARGHEVRVAYLKGKGTLADDFRRRGFSAIHEFRHQHTKAPFIGHRCSPRMRLRHLPVHSTDRFSQCPAAEKDADCHFFWPNDRQKGFWE